MGYRVWYKEEFDDYDADERDDRAWTAKPRWSGDTSHEPYDVRDAAKKYADYFHSQRDGWECTWPLEFVVHDGSVYFVVEVERETVPEFVAGKPRALEVP